MSEIKKGDLVMMVRGCCDYGRTHYGIKVGTIFESLGTYISRGECPKCKFKVNDGIFVQSSRNSIYSGFLRKIDPDSASEHDLKGAKLDKRDKELA